MEIHKVIRDSVHGDIALTEPEVAILDTPQMQRLRRIRQLTFCHFVYPGANHTRFEHSLGTLHIAGKIANYLGVEEGPLRAAALIHDIGHMPFSHGLEGVVRASHEDVAKSMLKSGQMKDLLGGLGYDTKELLRLASGEGAGKIISSQIDADRMDYLLRDAHYTGVAYGIIDVDRLTRVMQFDGERVYFKKKGQVALESLLVGRNQMISAVYRHHTVRVAEAMLHEGLRGLNLTVEQLLSMGDSDLERYAIENSERARRFLPLIGDRRLYKICCSVNRFADEKERADLRDDIVKKAKCCEDDVIVSQTEIKEDEVFRVLIDDGGIRPLTEVSEIVDYLRHNLTKLRLLEVCSPADCRERVRKACETLLRVP